MYVCEWWVFWVVWREMRYEARWSPVSLFISYLCWNFVFNDTSEQDHSRYKNPWWRNTVVTICRWYNFFFLMVKRNHFCSCVHTLQRFASMSGLMINIDKTVAVWIESRRNSQVKFIPELGFNWNPVTFKVLGVMFSTDLHETVPINCENKLIEMRKVLNAWSRRNLTPFGKITVIKSLVLSKITHLLLNLPDPDDNFLNTVVQFFVGWQNWQNKKIWCVPRIWSGWIEDGWCKILCVCTENQLA